MIFERLDHIQCEHTILVLIGDDPIPWDRCDGVKAELVDGETVYEPITLTRVRADNTVDRIVDWANRIGHTIEVRQIHLTQEAQETGHGLTVDGTVAGVNTTDKDDLFRAVLTAAGLSAMDAARANVALDELVIQPTGIRHLTSKGDDHDA